MKWSFSLGKLAGIDVRVHATFFLLLAWVAWGGYAADGTIDAALGGLLLVLLLFVIVVLHELGHALTARRYGVQTRDITLLPIGGVARLERMPDDPRHELAVAIAGPAVNVVLALLLAGALVLLGEPLRLELRSSGLLTELLWINVTLAVFNLIPAFPMDGGRALRAVLAMRMDTTRATEIAARLGKTLALGFGLLGLFVSPILLLIALFVWLGAHGELGVARFEGTLSGIRVGAATIREFGVLSPEDTLAVAAARAVAGFQHDFPVLAGGHVVGLLSHAAMLRAIAEHGLHTRVGEAMDGPPAVVHPDDSLVDVARRFQEGDARCLLVAGRGGELLGLLTLEGIGELFAVRQAADAGATGVGLDRRAAA